MAAASAVDAHLVACGSVLSKFEELSGELFYTRYVPMLVYAYT